LWAISARRFDIDDVAGRIADRLAEHRLGVLVDEAVEGLEIVGGRHAHLDALARERVHEQVVGAAIELAGRDDVVADAGNGLDGIGDGRHARWRRRGRRCRLPFRRRALPARPWSGS
jgi:hypothetical protein